MRMNDVFYTMGMQDARDLRNGAGELSGTEIIEREHSIPAFDPMKDYSQYPVGAPVLDEGQVWLLIQPHNAANYDGRPAALRALWGIAHTKNSKKAKAWEAPYGTSGMYMAGECYKDSAGNVHRALFDNLVHDAHAYPAGWEDVNE